MFDLNAWEELPNYVDKLRNIINKQFCWYWDTDELYASCLEHLTYLASRYDASFNVPFEAYATSYSLQYAYKCINRLYHEKFVYIEDWMFKIERDDYSYTEDGQELVDFYNYSNTFLKVLMYYDFGYEDVDAKDLLNNFMDKFMESLGKNPGTRIREKVEKILFSDFSVREIAEQEDCTKQYIYLIQRKMKEFYKENKGVY